MRILRTDCACVIGPLPVGKIVNRSASAGSDGGASLHPLTAKCQATKWILSPDRAERPARHFRWRVAFFYRSLAARCKAVERRKSQSDFRTRPMLCFFPERRSPYRGAKGVRFVRCRSEAPAERTAANRRISAGFAVSSSNCKSNGDPNAPCGGIRARPCRGEMLISEGKRPKVRISK